jgi:hypothetical protein
MTDLARAEQRLPRWMMGCATAGLLTALLMGQGRFGFGFALGAALAILNYYWLHEAVETLMGGGRGGLGPPGSAEKLTAIGSGGLGPPAEERLRPPGPATVRAKVPKSAVAKFLLRYPLAFGAVFAFYRTGWLPFMAVLAGFFVPVAGVLVEAFIQLVEGWS